MTYDSASAAIRAATGEVLDHRPDDSVGVVADASSVLSIASLLGHDPFADDRDRIKAKKPKSKKQEAFDVAIMDGLPALSSLSWVQAQLWDNGPGVKGKPRWNAKIKFTSVPAALINRDLVTAVRYCGLSTLPQFRENQRRRRDVPEWERAFVLDTMAFVRGQNSDRVHDQPETRIGSISFRYAGEGTITYPGQLLMLGWERAGDDWLPMFGLMQGHEDGRRESIVIPLKDHRQDIGRRDGASHFVGHHYSPAYARVLADRKARADETKAEAERPVTSR